MGTNAIPGLMAMIPITGLALHDSDPLVRAAASEARQRIGSADRTQPGVSPDTEANHGD
jgi:hypothetical protein